MHEVVLERAAEKDLKRLPKEIHARVVLALRALSENPRPVGCRKLEGSKSDWRIRVGDYRIVFEVDDPGGVVQIMRIRHRSEAYR